MWEPIKRPIKTTRMHGSLYIDATSTEITDAMEHMHDWEDDMVKLDKAKDLIRRMAEWFRPKLNPTTDVELWEIEQSLSLISEADDMLKS